MATRNISKKQAIKLQLNAAKDIMSAAVPLALERRINLWAHLNSFSEGDISLRITAIGREDENGKDTVHENWTLYYWENDSCANFMDRADDMLDEIVDFLKNISI